MGLFINMDALLPNASFLSGSWHCNANLLSQRLLCSQCRLSEPCSILSPLSSDCLYDDFGLAIVWYLIRRFCSRFDWLGLVSGRHLVMFFVTRCTVFLFLLHGVWCVDPV